MNKKGKGCIPILIILIVLHVSSIMAHATGSSTIIDLQIPELDESICSVNGQLIYGNFTADHGLEYYTYNPLTKKSSCLGKVSTVGRYSGDYALLDERFLLTCIAIDKRITKDSKIIKNPNETIRLICIDLKNGTTSEISRFNSISDLIYVEPINDHSILMYGRIAQISGMTTSYIDIFDVNDKKWSTVITVENEKISAATYDNDIIYTINENWGTSSPLYLDQISKPVYSFNHYDSTGNLIDRKTLDVNDLFMKEDESATFYRSLMAVDVSNNYIQFNDFGSESVLFTFNNGVITPIYSGSRLTCWKSSSNGFKTNEVYFTNLDGDSYLLTKDKNSFVQQPPNITTNYDVIRNIWDGTSDYVFAVLQSVTTGELKYALIS